MDGLVWAAVIWWWLGGKVPAHTTPFGLGRNKTNIYFKLCSYGVNKYRHHQYQKQNTLTSCQTQSSKTEETLWESFCDNVGSIFCIKMLIWSQNLWDSEAREVKTISIDLNCLIYLPRTYWERVGWDRGLGRNQWGKWNWIVTIFTIKLGLVSMCTGIRITTDILPISSHLSVLAASSNSK